MITVKFFKLNYPKSQYDRSGNPATITVDTDDYDKAFLAAVEAGGDPYRKMLFTVNEGAVAFTI